MAPRKIYRLDLTADQVIYLNAGFHCGIALRVGRLDSADLCVELMHRVEARNRDADAFLDPITNQLEKLEAAALKEVGVPPSGPTLGLLD